MKSVKKEVPIYMFTLTIDKRKCTTYEDGEVLILPTGENERNIGFVMCDTKEEKDAVKDAIYKVAREEMDKIWRRKLEEQEEQK